MSTANDSQQGPALNSESLLSVGLLGVIAIMLVPLPPFALDILLAVNLSFSILLLLIAEQRCG